MRQNINRFDIYNENFEGVFNDMLINITQPQLSVLPNDMKFKILKNKKHPASSFNFIEKVYILSTAFDKNITISIEDINDGVSKVEFRNAVLAQKGKLKNSELLKYPKTMASFILADKDLFSSMMYLNHVYTTEIYQLVRKINVAQRSKRDKLYNQGIETVKSLVKLFMNYELNKKMLIGEFGFDMAQFYAILYFSTGERLGVDFYNKDFKFSYSANKRDMSTALLVLYNNGYLFRRGEKRYTYSLTAKGLDVLNKIVERIIGFYKL